MEWIVIMLRVNSSLRITKKKDKLINGNVK